MSAIDDKYAELGGRRGLLGAPIRPESVTPDGSGRYRHYQHGSIYWSPATGAHELHGAIYTKWARLGWERGVLGYPVTDEATTPDGVGRYNHFQGGSIYWTPNTGANEVHGSIRAKWASLGWERGVLGYPVTDEATTQDGVGRYNHFQSGSIYWTPSTGAWEVHGAIRDRWAALGWETSSLGYPVSDELDTPAGMGRVSHFQGGSIYWDAGRGAYEVWPAPRPRPCSAATDGRWETSPSTSGVVGVHAALLRTNKVLFFTYREPADPHGPPAPQPNGAAAVWDLDTGAITTPAPASGERNLFCAGQSMLGDGRVFVGGGERQHVGVTSLHVFTPGGARGGSWQHVGDMPAGRWYPTCVTLPDGRVMMIGGRDWTSTANRANPTFEMYDPATGALTPRQRLPLLVGNAFDTYPFAFVLPGGRLFMHAGTRTRFLNLGTMADAGASLEAAARPDRNSRTYGLEGTAVLLPLDPDASPAYSARVMLIGGGGRPPVAMTTPATASCEVLDTSASAPGWILTAPMARPRVMPDAVLLPDGLVFVSNGSSTGFADNGANPVYDAELYDPATNVWRTVCPMSVPRLYHATSLLLPDGRVMTAGTDESWNPDPFHEAELRIELYSPPYLFAGPRPMITSAPPARAGYGTSISVGHAGTPAIASACLVRCGSVTHSFNSDQRLIKLRVIERRSNQVSLQAPPDGFVAPPGYYLLFLLTSAGVPSVGRFIRIGS
ncbi:MAG: DUF1929 domain-containing protein [Actinobacteria bacterium]|nr:DUF1929 domain-containing protein [Actinomycetota bacterium]